MMRKPKKNRERNLGGREHERTCACACLLYESLSSLSLSSDDEEPPNIPPAATEDSGSSDSSSAAATSSSAGWSPVAAGAAAPLDPPTVTSFSRPCAINSSTSLPSKPA